MPLLGPRRDLITKKAQKKGKLLSTPEERKDIRSGGGSRIAGHPILVYGCPRLAGESSRKKTEKKALRPPRSPALKTGSILGRSALVQLGRHWTCPRAKEKKKKRIQSCVREERQERGKKWDGLKERGEGGSFRIKPNNAAETARKGCPQGRGPCPRRGSSFRRACHPYC